MKHLWILPAALAAGCAPALSTAPVLAQQRQAVLTLAQRSAQDAAAVHASTAALLDIQRTAMIAQIESAALVATRPAGAEPGPIPGLDPAATALWYQRFTNALDNPDARRALVESRPEVTAFDAAAASLLAGLDERTAHTAALFDDVLEATGALEAAAGAPGRTAAPRELLAELYAQALRDRLDDPQRRAAADRLVARLLGTTPSGDPQ